MICLNVHSQNLRGSLRNYPGNIISTLEDKDCECTAILLQDLGTTGPDGPPSLRSIIGEHHLYANSKLDNKSRTVAIIVHKSWHFSNIYRDQTGSLTGVVASRGDTEVLLVSAYLPATLDIQGYPECKHKKSQKGKSERKDVKFLIPLRKKPTQFILASPNGLVVITYGWSEGI